MIRLSNANIIPIDVVKQIANINADEDELEMIVEDLLTFFDFIKYTQYIEE